jgi:hypothetical protein
LLTVRQCHDGRVWIGAQRCGIVSPEQEQIGVTVEKMADEG